MTKLDKRHNTLVVQIRSD